MSHTAYPYAISTYGLFPLHELLKHRMAFHTGEGLFRLIISQEEPDGQYITVTRFKTGHERFRCPSDTRNANAIRKMYRTERGKEEGERPKDREVTCYACKAARSPERAEPKNDRCHDKIESVLSTVTIESTVTER